MYKTTYHDLGNHDISKAIMAPPKARVSDLSILTPSCAHTGLSPGPHSLPMSTKPSEVPSRVDTTPFSHRENATLSLRIVHEWPTYNQPRSGSRVPPPGRWRLAVVLPRHTQHVQELAEPPGQQDRPFGDIVAHTRHAGAKPQSWAVLAGKEFGIAVPVDLSFLFGHCRLSYEKRSPQVGAADPPRDRNRYSHLVRFETYVRKVTKCGPQVDSPVGTHQQSRP